MCLNIPRQHPFMLLVKVNSRRGGGSCTVVSMQWKEEFQHSA
jgi:hypothetical protein